MTIPDEGRYDPAVHLSYADIALDDPRKPSFLRITIKQSKTEPFRKAMNLYIGRTGTDLCPVAAVLSYLTHRGSASGICILIGNLPNMEAVCGQSVCCTQTD